MQEPSIGRIVHYVLDKGPHAGAHRPAIIVAVANQYTVSLQVFTDGHKGDMPRGDECPNVFWRSACCIDEETKRPGHWHWPEQAQPKEARSERMFATEVGTA